LNFSNIFHTFSHFLFSKANREFLIFLAFFAVAGIFWVLMSLNESYEQEIRIPVKYTGIPKSVVMTSPETDTIRATIQDKGIVLLTYLYGDALKEIAINFKSYAGHKQGRGEVSTTELTKKIIQKLATSSKLVSIKPDRLLFYYNFGEKKKVPVKWTGTVIPEDIHFLSAAEFDNDSITIFASREKLDSINAVYTLPLNYTDFHDTLVVTTKLQKIAGVKMVPETVTIRFSTDILTEETIDNIPITCINVPEGIVLRTFPTKTSVKIVTGMKTFQTLSPDDFIIVADYNEIKNNMKSTCKIHLKKAPKNISRISLMKEEVDYLIEKLYP
jgi:hypothetical protein